MKTTINCIKKVHSAALTLGFLILINLTAFSATYHADVKKAFRHENCIYVIYDIYYHEGNNVTWNPNDPGWTYVGTQTAKLCNITIPENPFVPPDSSANRGYWPFDYNGLNLSEFPPHVSLSLFSYVVSDVDSAAKIILPASSDRWFVSFYDNYEGRPVYEEDIITTQGFIRLPKNFNYVMERRAFIVIVLLDRTTNTLYILHD